MDEESDADGEAAIEETQPYKDDDSGLEAAQATQAYDGLEATQAYDGVEDSDGDEDKGEAADEVGPLPGNTNTEGEGVEATTRPVDANATQVKPV